MYQTKKDYKSRLVLIDTWWNVNVFLSNDRPVSFGFNRYMVECESNRKDIPSISPRCFNRYMVECECSLLYPAFDNVPRFNRYMVECECLRMLAAVPAAALF